MIAVDGVTKRFGELVAVEDLAFEVRAGEVVGFLGPNGAGKTTTMRMLTGTLQPDAGQVLFDGRSIGDDLAAAKRRVGYLPESNPLYDDMLVCDHLEYVATLRGLSGPSARNAVRAAADRTAIDDVFFRPIGEISKGYRQRVGLAAAILHEPEVLILDEPTEGLDPNQRVEIRRLITELGAARTVLLSTHVMQEVETTCTRVLIISGGRLVADGSVADLIARREGVARYTVEVAGDGVADALAALPGVETHTVAHLDDRVRVRLTAPTNVELRPRISSLVAERGWTLWELYRERASLEQVFHELTVTTPSAEATRAVNTAGGTGAGPVSAAQGSAADFRSAAEVPEADQDEEAER